MGVSIAEQAAPAVYQDIWNRIVSMEKQQMASSASIGAQISWMDSSL